MELLKKLTSCFAPSGREYEIRKVITEEIKPYVDEIMTDSLGNLIARKKGNKSKVMLAGHMDEIGVVATVSDKDGFIRFSPVGGIYNKDLVGRRVVFKNGVVGVIGSEEDNKDRKISKMFIDIGVKNEDGSLVKTGDMAVFCGDFYENGDCVISKALDNRAGCYALIETIKRVKSDNDLYFVFTSQEEVGLRGAKTSSYAISPDYALSVDVTDTGDTPNGIKCAVKMGKGAAIKVMDRSVLCDYLVRDILIKLAREKGIDYQLEVMCDGGTDAGAIAVSGAGVRTGGISVPTRYIHSPSEMISKKDLSDCVELLKLFAEFDFGGNGIEQ